MLEKVKLPEAQFFYRIAMQRSAELKRQMQEMVDGSKSSEQSKQIVELGIFHDEQTSGYNPETTKT